MEDLLRGLRRPCVMDCKMGGRSTPPGAPASKHLLQRAMYAHREKLGFIITGFKVFPPGKKARYYSIMHGRSLNEEGVFAKGFLPFLEPAGSSSRICRVATEIVRQLEQLRAWFTEQRIYLFYASSLLIAYESAPTQADELGVVVRMVDFAHATPAAAATAAAMATAAAPDENYLLGLGRLIDYFRRAVAESAALPPG
ncbi:hypothetical protein BOX15_Mlig013817g1 [Macrostomum lignano]|uniref:Kinase n=2 Tax=Macrostomum lignano TaxID=282301 RepID=A0A267FWD5_9PLAT|nr:hypothetical protein BOX15_Mlig013817g4 [Macrostomum lignano]PAA75560.1 hypothetical protein BOX15_Mlig013817g2 [Macrostomum lignano]PAA77282.1 hypothetical protein BOX15_Mlig013817g1 [Macrostomum lignano]